MGMVSGGVEPVLGCKSKEIDMSLFPFGWSAAISASSSHESKRLPLQHREVDLNYDMAAVAQAQIARRNVTECVDLLPSSRTNEEYPDH